MDIVINSLPLLSPLTGIGQYTYQISKALKERDAANQYTYYYGFFSKELYLSNRSNGNQAMSKSSDDWFKAYLNAKNLIRKVPVLGFAGKSVRTSFVKISQFLKRKRFDLYFEPNFIALDEIYADHVVTMVFDLSVIHHPEWHPDDRVKDFEKRFPKGLRRSDAVLTATDFMKGQIIEILKVPESSVYVTPISYDREHFRVMDKESSGVQAKVLGVPENFILFVGNIEPRKNIMGLLKAYRFLPESLRKDLYIVFCGPPGWKNENVLRFIDADGLKDKVIFKSYVTNQELSVLYNRAKALVYPSFYEGFGLPPLEAMACGCPVVVSDIPTHREVCGHAALYVDPRDPEEIAKSIKILLDEPELRESCIKKGLDQSKKFSWEKTAGKTLEIFNKLNPE